MNQHSDSGPGFGEIKDVVTFSVFTIYDAYVTTSEILFSDYQ